MTEFLLLLLMLLTAIGALCFIGLTLYVLDEHDYLAGALCGFVALLFIGFFLRLVEVLL